MMQYDLNKKLNSSCGLYSCKVELKNTFNQEKWIYIKKGTNVYYKDNI